MSDVVTDEEAGGAGARRSCHALEMLPAGRILRDAEVEAQGLTVVFEGGELPMNVRSCGSIGSRGCS